MKNKIFFITLISIISFNCYSQTTFEKGYFINNNGEKTDCLIKNIDWRKNPTEFEYKLSEDKASQNTTIKYVKEFGIENISKYIRKTVKIDKSFDDINKLSTDRNPILEEEELFLKVLVEGNATLLKYQGKDLMRFFYKKDSTDIEQLIYKRFMTDDGKIDKNNQFKQQLWISLKCQDISMMNVNNIDYKTNDLVNIFVKYNKCNNSDFVNFEKKEKRDLFNLTIRPGLSSSSLMINNKGSNNNNIDFGNKLNLRFGIEAEFILPFNNSKWAVLIEPTYKYYKSQTTSGNQTVIVDFKSIEFPLGLRHYFFLNNNSKIFLNGNLSLNYSLNSKINFNPGSELEIRTKTNIEFGLGYKYKNKYSLEIRYSLKRNLLEDYLYWESEYKSASLIFGYTIF